MLFIIFILIFLSTYVNSTVSGYFGIAIALLMSMAVIRSVYYRRFTNKIYKPFLEVNGFLDEQLTSRYLLNSPEPLNIEEIKCGSLKASINTLEIKDHNHIYMIETKNSNNEIESYLRKVINQKYTLTLILKD